MSDRPILIVEDSAEDYGLTERALRKAGVEAPIQWCRTGDEALRYLAQRGEHTERVAVPALILLDLKLPGTNGREVLTQLKSDPDLRSIPVVVLSTSTSDRDVNDCYALGANTYITKPLSLDHFVRSMRQLGDYWFEAALLPDKS